MQVIESEQIVCFDIDDTLVMHNQNPNDDFLLQITCPYTDSIISVKAHAAHIQLLKEKAARGFKIIVWSQGGWLWAKTVIETLGLQPYVSFIMSKPALIVDDLPASTWLDHRLYMDPAKPYKGFTCFD